MLAREFVWGVFYCFLFLCLNVNLTAQCDTGEEPSCKCETAEVLCSINELDGYTYSMSEYLHPEDGPNEGGNLCDDDNTISNNPTWFAFTAWCTDLEIRVEIEDCSYKYEYLFGIPISSTHGIQLSIYDGCEPDAEHVACDLSCGNEFDKFLSLEDLVVGKKYYMVVDGCKGSACESIKINVLNPCGPTIVEEWKNFATDTIHQCIDTEINLSVQELDGANRYHWFINGDEEKVSDTTDFIYKFDQEGIYEVCVDASNDPCIDISEAPEPFCRTVEVHRYTENDLQVSSSIACPGDEITISTSEQEDDKFVTTLFLYKNNDTLGTYDATEFSYASLECGRYSVRALTSPQFTVSQEEYDWLIMNPDSTNCFDVDRLDFSVEDDKKPQFINAPEDVEVYCLTDIPPLLPLSYTDNCIEDGFVTGTETRTDSPCYPIITRTWSIVDSCGNEASHTQFITVEPHQLIFILDPPLDMTVSCVSDIPEMTMLNYNHLCEGSGLVDGIESRDTTDCEIIITRFWKVADSCGQADSVEQIITVSLEGFTLEADFVPVDIVLACGEEIPPLEPIAISHPCDGSISIQGEEIGNVDYCSGGTLERRWVYVDDCVGEVKFLQSIEINPASKPSFTSQPRDTTLTCEEYERYVFSTLAYSNNDLDECATSGEIKPVIVADAECGDEIQVIWEGEDNCGNELLYIQNIYIEPRIEIEPEFSAPNIFNPEYGGFTIYGNESVIAIEEMSIYDRWGNTVFEAKDLLPNEASMGWDGSYQSKRAEPGVYIYKVKLLFKSRETELLTGDVTLVR